MATSIPFREAAFAHVVAIVLAERCDAPLLSEVDSCQVRWVVYSASTLLKGIFLGGGKT